MQPKGSLFLQLLINKFHPSNPEAITRVLPENVQMSLKESSIRGGDPTLLLPFHDGLFDKVHYSWFLEPLQKAEAPLQPCILFSFKKELQEKLLKYFPECKETTYASPVKAFFLQHFANLFQEKTDNATPLPIHLLEKTPLDVLLELKKEELVQLIDLLPMQDLAEEVRHIVDKKLIQAIVSDLSLNQQKYLKACLHQKAKIQIPPLNVREIHKDKKAFLIALHKRGLKRLAIAISGLSSDFVWHLSHILDRGRGKILLEQFQADEIPLQTKIVQMQILQIVPLLKAKNE